MSRRISLAVGLLASGAVITSLLAPGAGAAFDLGQPPVGYGAPETSRVRQAVQLNVHPQLAQPGKKTAKAKKARVALTANFKPVRKGRAALLQKRTSSGWSVVSKGRQNGKGRVEFVAPYKSKGRSLTYRAVAAAGGGLGTVKSNTVKSTGAGKADWTDDFNGKQLGSDWEHRLQGYSAESLRRCSRAGKAAVKVKGGAVRLSVIDDPNRPSTEDRVTGNEKCRVDGADYEWRLNGHIGTMGAQDFKYGYAAARVKFQPRRGQHASFWMQPTSTAAPEGSAKKTGAEIDVIEWFGEGHPQGGLTSFIWHYPDNGGEGKTGVKVGGFIKNPRQYGKNWADRYHVFSVEWTKKRYVFRIDGKETFRTTKGVSGREQYLILSLLSSDYELQYLGDEKRLPQTMSVDWVRYWDR